MKPVGDNARHPSSETRSIAPGDSGRPNHNLGRSINAIQLTNPSGIENAQSCPKIETSNSLLVASRISELGEAGRRMAGVDLISIADSHAWRLTGLLSLIDLAILAGSRRWAKMGNFPPSRGRKTGQPW